MIQDFYKKNFGTTASQAILTHLKQELMHAIWELILNHFRQPLLTTYLG